ncbi:hypothetical protein K7432_000571 [Basidiobolus ranarum]|uniref:Pentatricopeptide repeat-containing protein n=1 Tax=Basidiobolus ranarum TaxID=34480 RepID=A0ABR2WAZ2_9FUNG
MRSTRAFLRLGRSINRLQTGTEPIVSSWWCSCKNERKFSGLSTSRDQSSPMKLFPMNHEPSYSSALSKNKITIQCENRQINTALGLDILRILSTQQPVTELTRLQLPKSVSDSLISTDSPLERWRILFKYQIASQMEIPFEFYVAYVNRLLKNHLMAELIEVFNTLSTKAQKEALLFELLVRPLPTIESTSYLSLLRLLIPSQIHFTQEIVDRVTQLFVNLGDIDSLLKISRGIPKQLHLSPSLFNNLIVYFLMKDDVNLTMNYYAMATSSKTKIYPSTYAELITMCMSHDRPEDGMVVYRDYMRSLPRSNNWRGRTARVDTRIFNTLILEHSNRGRMQEAHQVLNDMLAMGVFPYSRVYGYIVAGYVKQENFKKAHSIIRKMREVNRRVPTIVYNSLINGVVEAGRMNEAVEIFNEMLEGQTKANHYVCTTLINGYAKVGDMLQANKWFTWMKKNDIEPNVFTYNALVNGYMKQLKVKNVQEVLEEMTARGVSPNVVTYTSLIYQANHSLDTSTAMNLYQKMLEADITPDVVTYAVLLQGYVQSFDVQGAWKLYEEMRKNRIKPDVYVYSSLLDLFAKVKDMESARIVLELMKKDQVDPNMYSYSSLLTLCFRSNDRTNARWVYEKMNEISNSTSHTTTKPSRIGSFNVPAGI